MSAQWLAVRCCCRPQKLLGFLRVSGSLNSITLPGPAGAETFPIEWMSEWDGGSKSPVRERAIKSENHELEFWRRVPGFVEAMGPRPTFQFEGVGDLADVRFTFKPDFRQ